ncbi:hypothetical protein SFUMM280S_00444 [Streptomyces fumanus]
MAQYERVDKVRLLVVDDCNPPIADLVATVARYEGSAAAPPPVLQDALRTAGWFRPDIVVLDLMLPDIDGFGVLDELRRSGRMVPAASPWPVYYQVRTGAGGLTLGGDDYLVKPFAVEELMVEAASPAAQRRTLVPGALAPRVGDPTMDEDTREVRRGGTLIALTPTEYEVLRYLMREVAGRRHAKAQILDHVLGSTASAAGPTWWNWSSAGCAASSTRPEAGRAADPHRARLRVRAAPDRPVIRRLWRSLPAAAPGHPPRARPRCCRWRCSPWWARR